MRSLGLAFALLTLTVAPGCNKDAPEPQDIPIPGAEAPAVVTSEPAAGDAGDVTDAGVVAPEPTAPNTVTAPVQQASIDSCCAALKAVAKSGKDKAAKQQAAQASAVCPGIAALVKSGTTSRSSGLTQVRSALVGTSVPSECR